MTVHKKIQALRGMNDVAPPDAPVWALITQALSQLMHQYNYERIQTPLLEPTHLFKRTIGDATDIVEKEMFTFTDRDQLSISLRPEGTASCVRAGIEHGWLYNQIQRLWYMGPMFRYERPQKGRYRQFTQLGAEAFGMAGPEIDFEMTLMANRLWRVLEISDHVHLQINTLGTPLLRDAYQKQLIHYFTLNESALDADAKRRLHSNPMRILDSKNPAMAPIIAGAPLLIDHLDDATRNQFQRYCQLLDTSGIPYTVNPRLVRGLDYYDHIVYEWVSDSLGAQATVCAGGRYDRLVDQLGGHSTPACGFAIGIERLVLILQKHQQHSSHTDIYVAAPCPESQSQGFSITEQLRNHLPGLSITYNLCGGNLKRQMKRADQSGARWAVVISDSDQTIRLKDLRSLQAATSLSIAQAIDILSNTTEQGAH